MRAFSKAMRCYLTIPIGPDGGSWTGRGLRVLNQAKPSVSPAGLLGPRVQMSYESRGSRAAIPAEVCFKLWAEDAATREVVDVVANDDGEPLPPPMAPGVWCYGTFETLL
jgi:hypothetical protein